MLTKKEFGKLFDKYIDDVTSFLYTYASSKAELKDWTQEVFIKIWGKRHDIDFNHFAFKSYLLKTARNHALKKLKKKRKYEIWLEENLKKITKNQLPEELVIAQSDVKEVYKAALSKISLRARKAYLLSREEGLSYPEIAEVMDISTKTVETHISKALSILRRELRDYSYSNFQ